MLVFTILNLSAERKRESVQSTRYQKLSASNSLTLERVMLTPKNEFEFIYNIEWPERKPFCWDHAPYVKIYMWKLGNPFRSYIPKLLKVLDQRGSATQEGKTPLTDDHPKGDVATVELHQKTPTPTLEVGCQSRRGNRDRISRRRRKATILGGFCTSANQGSRRHEVGSYSSRPQAVVEDESIPFELQFVAENSLVLL